MKCRTMKEEFIKFQWILLTLLIIYFGSCKEEKGATSAPYDPSQPIEVTDFTPQKGGGKKKMIIYGSNFGTDPSLVSVKVGGKEAVVVNAKGTSIYCMTPERCFEGTVEVKVGEQAVIASAKYEYDPQTVVSDLCGDVDELGQGDLVPIGPFDNCGKIEYPYWFSFDPQKDHKILYLAQAGPAGATRPLRVLDLEKKMIYTKSITGIARLYTITWTNSGDMVLAVPQNNNPEARNNIILQRQSSTDGQDFKDVTHSILTRGNACTASMILPQTGELYFTFRNMGNVYRYNFEENGWNQNPKVPNGEGLKDLLAFSVPNKEVDYSLVPHPKGKYVYVIMHNNHYILRSNYDEETKRLVTPYVVCGQADQAEYKDLVGTNARLNEPGQGVFVYNKKYEEEDKEDHYDFYFTDTKNHCIRILTPEGVVSTFAGRGSSSTSVAKYGKQNGEVRERARFKEPRGLAYDEDTKTFYVGDAGNFKIRKIAKELESDPVEPDDEQTNEKLPEEGE